MTTRLRKLLLGNTPYIPSRSKYKRVVLTSQLCVMTIIVCLAFSTIDSASPLGHSNIPFQLGCALLAIMSLLLNRAGRHMAARVLLVISVNITIYFFSEREPTQIGLYLFFIVINIGTIAAFGYEDRNLAIAFLCLSVTLFVISLYTDLPGVKSVTPPHDGYITNNLLANFLISFMASTLIIYFLIHLNYRSERSLRENEREMMIKNEELTKLNAELDQFTYSTSHDLRSPISSVLGLVQLAKMTDDVSEIKKYVDMMEGRLASLNKFIKDISDYSRNARTEMNYETVSVKPVIHEIVENLKFYPGAEKVRIDVDIDRDFTLTTDPTRLHVIFSNLIANSFKYTDPYKDNKFIKVSAQMNATHVHFKVEDNGVGIQEHYLPKIFDMFFQAHQKSEGSGLGLYIVKEAVKKLNGTIEAKSKLEVGTLFEVNLPKG